MVFRSPRVGKAHDAGAVALAVVPGVVFCVHRGWQARAILNVRNSANVAAVTPQHALQPWERKAHAAGTSPDRRAPQIGSARAVRCDPERAAARALGGFDSPLERARAPAAPMRQTAGACGTATLELKVSCFARPVPVYGARTNLRLLRFVSRAPQRWPAQVWKKPWKSVVG